MNNFYNEPAPMRELASLGTSIPSPALAACITAVLCVKLGNAYGTSFNAQHFADQVLAGISKDRWLYYLNGRLEQDRTILAKLTVDRPLDNWMSLVGELEIEPEGVTSKDVSALIAATNAGNKARVRTIAQRMYLSALAV
jgi:hypothetical protein